MGILAVAADERVADVAITEDELTVRLMDGRSISAPLAWYPRLLNATEEQRQGWKISGGGYGIHWKEIDEDLSVEGLLRGIPGPQQAVFTLQAAKPEETAPSQLGPVAFVSTDTDDHEKGILDYFLEVEEASNELLNLLLHIANQIEDITSKVTKRTAQIEDFTSKVTDGLTSVSGGAETVSGIKARDLKAILLLLAAEISDFSKEIEDTTPVFKRNTQKLEESLSVYVSLAQPENSENLTQLHTLKETLSNSLDSVRSSKEQMMVFKDAVELVRGQGLDQAMNKATSRQTKAIVGLITNIEEFESFSLRIMFQIDSKLGQS